MRSKCAIFGPNLLTYMRNVYRRLNVSFYHHNHHSGELELENEQPSSEWYERAYLKLIKLTHALKNVDLIDGRLIDVYNESIIRDDRIDRKMQLFKFLARTFIGSPSMQRELKKAASSAAHSIPSGCFSKLNQRDPITLNSLTKVCDFLNVSSQQRSVVRFTICRQVTRVHIWRGALEELLKNLKSEMGTGNYDPTMPRPQLGEQIVSSCINFLANTSNSSDPELPSWMRLASTKKSGSPPYHRWGEVLEMFHDLTKWLKHEERLAYHVSKIDAMKEGLYQIKDVLVDREIGYKEACRQECLVQKKLSQNLGHSSKCLFMLLMYYLYGRVADIEVEVCGGVYKSGGGFCLCVGKVLVSDEERMVWSGIKQLDRALGLFRFVWETAGMKGVLELQGHVWCVGAEERILEYRGNAFFIHGIRL